jgi:peptidoglycan/xylan/chitin deacetylase (PgdA/CDA1 family)
VAVAVTIDVEHPCRPAPDPIATLKSLIAIADEADQRVNWFVQGRWASAYPHLVGEFVARGDLIALHGYSHVDHRRLTSRGLRLEVQEGLAAIRDAVPEASVRFCRLPYGHGSDLPEVRAALEEYELTPVGWDYSSFDWDESLPDATSARRLLGAVESGGVVLLHSWPRRAPVVLSTLLETLGTERAVALVDLDLPGRGPQGWRVHEQLMDQPRHYPSDGES